MVRDEDFEDDFEQEGEQTICLEPQSGDKRKRLFSKELRCMMYGFGDDQNPYTESVDLLEDLVIDYIIEIACHVDEIVHFVINNQVGFTANSGDTGVIRYSTEFAKIINNPIMHFNGDIEAGLKTTSIAMKYRQKIAGCSTCNNVCITYRAMEIGKQGRVQVENIMFLMRKDAKKFTRVKELLTMNEELKKARKAFDEVKYAGL